MEVCAIQVYVSMHTPKHMKILSKYHSHVHTHAHVAKVLKKAMLALCEGLRAPQSLKQPDTIALPHLVPIGLPSQGTIRPQ